MRPSLAAFFKRQPERMSEQTCPCVTLSNVPSLVVLPGLRYDLTFSETMGLNIINYFKKPDGQKHTNFEAIKKLEIEDKLIKTASQVESKDIEKFRHIQLNTSNYICLIPSRTTDYSTGCVARITKVTMNDNKSIIISFKAVCRAAIKNPVYQSDSNKSNNEIWESEIIMFNEFEKLCETHKEKINVGVQNILSVIHGVDRNITDFNKRYRDALKTNSTDHLLLLTPLSNTLYFQLNKEQFKGPWKLLYAEFKDIEKSFTHEATISYETAFKLLKLLDFIIGVLPTSTLQKIEFLSCMEIDIRVTSFVNLINDFNQIFDQLFSSVEYVKRFYDNASTLEKATLIANQLRSLKVFIQDVKSSNKRNLIHGERSLAKPINGKLYNKIQQQRALANNTSSKDQEDYYEEDDDISGNEDIREISKFIHKLKKMHIHPDGQKMLLKDYKRIKKMNAQSAEYQVLRNYFDIILDVPFNKLTKSKRIDISQSKQKLDSDHFGLKSVKKRLIEYLCVLKLNDQLGQMGKPPILLLVGPPGVGKTSIAKSIATVLNRNYQRISLGGVHNESDLRGHRRTYVGSMCGQVVNAIRKSDTMNPLILLDEIDKVSSSIGSGVSRNGNGDPSAALLEVLDPEQNFSFMDHYLGFPIDLSQVLFICTANDITSISKPLLDRMEVIKIPGYTLEEKIEIGKRFLLPKQIKLNGLDKCNGIFSIEPNAWQVIVSEYTRESGVRNLERVVSKIVRGKVVEYIKNDNKFPSKQKEITTNELIKYLGFPLHPITKELLSTIKLATSEGVVNGLSYNSDGTGSVLVFEIIKIGDKKDSMEGPSIKSTGNLGNILQESIDIGSSVVMSILKRSIIENVDSALIRDYFNGEYHLHVPMGSIAKDGPSAGVAITLALLSLAIQKPVDPYLCMTGEITLRGKIIPIGGLKEKLLGAKMYGMRRVLVPRGNRSDVIESVIDKEEISDNKDDIINSKEYKELEIAREKMGLQVIYVDTIYDVLNKVWPTLKLRSYSENTVNDNVHNYQHELSSAKFKGLQQKKVVHSESSKF